MVQHFRLEAHGQPLKLYFDSWKKSKDGARQSAAGQAARKSLFARQIGNVSQGWK